MTIRSSLSPLFRQSIGFDRFNDLFESALQGPDISGYPPYNVEKRGEDAYRIVIAAAGFRDNDISAQVERGVLTIEGRKADKPEEGTVTLYQGIAQRAFRLTFRLADYIEVKGATLTDGLLQIELRRNIPEEAKPIRIPIASQSVTQQAEVIAA